MAWAPRKRTRDWRVVDQRRLSPAQRGYDHRWEEASQLYRAAHPLCVHCLLQDRTAPSRCVDHIAPIACCPELQWDELNWAALCLSCHGYKTAKEPRAPWAANRERVVVCGLPGAGKRTWCQERGEAYFDADELGLVDVGAVISARTEFIQQHRGACSVIVASTVTASRVASQLRGVVRHQTKVFEDRPVRKRDA
jgi:hypothetical protein